MKKPKFVLPGGFLTGAAICALGAVFFNLDSPAEAKGFLPSDPAKVIALGKALFYDKTLSNPPGMACVSCHAPETGYSYPNSVINKFFGTVPGTVAGRFGNRKPPSLAYAPYMLSGTPHFDQDAQAFVGGLFWDGRAKDAVAQAKAPFMNPNEMNNLDDDLASKEMVVAKLKSGANAKLFVAAYGPKVFSRPAAQVYDLMADAIVAFEKSPEVSPFTSKYDAYLEGKATLTPSELLGLRLATGTLDGRPGSIPFRKSAHCMDCHGASTDLKKARDLWTNSCYANLGVPRNLLNPYYAMQNAESNPAGYNRQGVGFVDLGLGESLYPLLGLLSGGFEYGDPLRINGAFKAPSLRNVDKRPYPEFVKAYMHNGAFKSLKEVVHFYNTRNLTTCPGELIDFTRADPYEGLKGTPLWARPEYLNPNTLINPSGISAGGAFVRAKPGMSADLDAEQIGNLKLSDIQENAIVAFLKTLSDGYFKRN